MIGADGAQANNIQETGALLNLPQDALLSQAPIDEPPSSEGEHIIEVAEAEAFVFDTPSEQGARATVPVSLAISTKIASAIARPLASLNADHAPFGSMSLHDVRSIAQNPFFTGPLNRAAAELSGLSKITFDKNHIRRLGHNSASQLVMLLATGDSEHAEQAGLLVGAIVLHKHLLARALKAEREQLQELLGADIYRIATREAPVLYAPLAELDDGSFSIPRVFAKNPVQVRETALRIIAVGQRILHDFVHIIEPSLSPLFGFRMSYQPETESNHFKTIVMTDRHSAHIIRLLRRRFEPWLHTID